MALGIHAQAVWASMRDSEGAGQITSRGLTLGVSASYN